MMRGWLRALLAIALALTLHAVLAHGDREPRHGGLLSIGGEISFELVRRGAELIIYVDDHGSPVPTAGATGTLQIQGKGPVRSVPVTSASENALKSPAADYAAGDKLLLQVQLGSGLFLTGRFVIP